MRFRILTLLAFMTLCSLPCFVNAATYNWYFSNDATGNAVGSDTTGDGTIGDPWKTLQKAENVMKVKNSGDVVNLYFDRGDTWNFATNVLEVFSVETGDPVVHIKAYGSEALPRPIFQGDVSDFSAAEYDGTGDWHRYNRVFHFEVDGCSIDNVEIKDAYGMAIYLYSGDSFTLSNSVIHNVGNCFIDVRGASGATNNTVEYNKLYDGMLLHLYGKQGAKKWSQGVSFYDDGVTLCENNTIRYNLIYNVAGEGIAAPNSTIEYNVIGDTASVAIDSSVADFDAGTAVIRYNLVIMSNWASSVYDDPAGGPSGIRVYDENAGGDNSGADISIYGNIVINRYNGLWVFNNQDTGNPFGSVKIYNNTIIDSHNSNLMFLNPDEFLAVNIYNNSSVLYDRPGSKHANFIKTESTWNIDYNHFWTKGGSPYVPSPWLSNYVTTDPKLPGEPTLDWDGLSGKKYFHMIDFGKHLYISSDSNLANAGKILGSGYSSNFLTAGTDFSKLKFQRISQPKSGKWCIGAIIPKYIGIPPKPDYLPPPRDLTISFIPN